MQELISRGGGKIQFQTFDTSLYGTAHPTELSTAFRSSLLLTDMSQFLLFLRRKNQVLRNINANLLSLALINVLAIASL